MPQKPYAVDAAFFTPERFAQDQAQRMDSHRGRLLFAGCCAGSYLSTRVVQRYQKLLSQTDSADDVPHMANIDRRFSDTETCVRLETHVSGYDVFLFQTLLDPTSDLTVDQNYMAFLIAARTFREQGASHVTGVFPYLAYARQDKPTTFRREAVTAKLMADLTVAAGVDRMIVWEPHSEQLRGFYGGMPVNTLDPLTLFIDEFEDLRGRDDVIAVAPDAGASKFVTHFGRAIGVKCAIAAKYRPRPEEVVISEIIGDFSGKRVAVILDDMISGGGTMHSLIVKLVAEKGIEEAHLGVSHNLCVGKALERLTELHEKYGLKRVVISNSIPQTEEFRSLPFITERCLSDPLARTINRIHYNRSVSDVFYRP